MLPTITDKRLLDKERTVTSFRYFVHIVSQHQEDDGYGYPVPVEVLLLDVVVSEPTRACIRRVLDEAGYQEYEIADYWRPCSFEPILDAF